MPCALRSSAAALVLVALARHAHAQPASLQFSADQASIDPATHALSLQGHVQLSYGRYSLRSDKLHAVLLEDRLQVDGPAQLLLCPCAQAPVRIGFDQAQVRSSSDLFVRNARLQLGDTTVLTLPWVWLRSADRMGLLAPRVAWRGPDGLILGQGVHLPWHNAQGQRSWLDLYLSGYVRGGYELAPTLVTPASSTTVRWDSRSGRQLLSVSSQGALSETGQRASLAWQADLVRGEHAIEALFDVRQASLRLDSAQAQTALRLGRGTVAATGVEAYGLRGSSQALFWGPSARLSSQGAMPFGQGLWRTHLASRFFGDGNQSRSELVTAAGASELSGTVSVFAWNASAALNATALLLDHDQALDRAAMSRLSLGLPLVRSYSSAQHRLEPYLSALMSTARSNDQLAPVSGRPSLLERGSQGVAAAGLRSVIEPPSGARFETTLVAGAAYALHPHAEYEPAWAAHALLAGDWAMLGAEVFGQWKGPSKGVSANASGRIGKLDGAQLWSRVIAQGRGEASAGRALVFDPMSPQPFRWVDRHGSSLAVGTQSPLGRGYRGLLGTDWDLGQGTLLASSAGLGYRHPCGCLGATAWVSKRLGRDGVDGWLGLDLAPP